MFPRTHGDEFEVQLQIHQNKEIAQILNTNDQDRTLKSISLKPGHEYTIEIVPRGRRSTEDFKRLHKHDRKCQLDDEIDENSMFKIYSKANCRYECEVSLAHSICQCIPWDFFPTLHNPKAEVCDVFGRKCFQTAVNNITKDGNSCKHCMDECDRMKFRLRILNENELTSKENLYINYEYFIILKLHFYLDINSVLKNLLCFLKRSGKCSGSHSLCEYLIDSGDVLMEDSLKKLFKQDISKQAEFISKNIIIVHLKFQSSKVEMTVQEARSAFLGGIY